MRSAARLRAYAAVRLHHRGLLVGPTFGPGGLGKMGSMSGVLLGMTIGDLSIYAYFNIRIGLEVYLSGFGGFSMGTD